MERKTVVLLYQAGIANVFEASARELCSDPTGRVRLLQSDFRECEAFARGMERAGCVVYSFHANVAGDATHAKWDANLDESPFRDKMRPVGSFVLPKQD